MTHTRGKITVQFYSGYKGEETPRSFSVGGKEYAVEEVISRKRGLDKDSGEHYELFVCRVAGKTVTIRKNESGEWEIRPSADFPLPSKK
jgi:hypothetical protein